MQARITSGDPDLIHLDTEKFLSKNIAIRIGDKEITSFKRGQKLPIIITKILKKEKNDDVLEIKSYNSDFVKVPDQEALTLTFQINLDEIYFVKFSPSYVICVNKNNVIIYNEETQSLTRFPASIDYESDHSKIGVNYRGETVINDVIKNFGKLSCDSVIPIRQYSSPKEIKRYYILKFGKNEHLIDEEKVIVDLFEEAIKQSGISKKYITLTIPSHFSDSQKFAYLKAAEVAGFTDVNSVDEQIALAFGYEKEYDIAENIEYLLINFCDTLIKITLNKAGDLNKENCRRKIIDCENLVSSKLSFFDKIIIDAAGENKPQNENNNFELSLQNFIDAVNELITNVPDLTSIVITWNHFYYVFLQDHFPTFQITFIQNPEELIVKGAAMA
uniref:Uncharacterized protein n=1 Tax=Panagrolaimus sp. ES5 TaxID=591445 RepID=A0AC34FWV6_9BILA